MANSDSLLQPPVSARRWSISRACPSDGSLQASLIRVLRRRRRASGRTRCRACGDESPSPTFSEGFSRSIRVWLSSEVLIDSRICVPLLDLQKDLSPRDVSAWCVTADINQSSVFRPSAESSTTCCLLFIRYSGKLSQSASA